MVGGEKDRIPLQSWLRMCIYEKLACIIGYRGIDWDCGIFFRDADFAGGFGGGLLFPKADNTGMGSS